MYTVTALSGEWDDCPMKLNIKNWDTVWIEVCQSCRGEGCILIYGKKGTGFCMHAETVLEFEYYITKLVGMFCIFIVWFRQLLQAHRQGGFEGVRS